MKTQYVAALVVSLAACVDGFAPVRTARGVPVPAHSVVSKSGYGMSSAATIRYSWQQPQSAYGAPAQNQFGGPGQNQFGSQGAGGALPFGWSEENDGQGSTYYYNQQTGETSWERPGGMQQQQQAPGRQVFGGTFSPAGSSGQNQFGNRGAGGQGQNSFGGRPGAGGQNSFGGGYQGAASRMAGGPGQNSFGNQQQGRGFGRQRKLHENTAQEDMYARLIREEQEKHGGQPFTYGGSPGQAQNSFGGPVGATGAGRPGQSSFGGRPGASGPGQSSFGGGYQGAAARMGQNQFGNQGAGGALPFGWSEENDGQGNSYYYNQQTGETTWERPGGMQQQQQQSSFGNRGAGGPGQNSFGAPGQNAYGAQGHGQSSFGNRGAAAPAQRW